MKKITGRSKRSGVDQIALDMSRVRGLTALWTGLEVRDPLALKRKINFDNYRLPSNFDLESYFHVVFNKLLYLESLQ